MNPRKASFLLMVLAKRNPQAWDAIFPHGPRMSRASREYFIALVLKGFAHELPNRDAAAKLAGVQKSLVKFAAERLVADYDDDDRCGSTPHVHGKGVVPPPHEQPWWANAVLALDAGLTMFSEPYPNPWVASTSFAALNPHPLPPEALQKEIGGYLLMLAGVTTLEAVGKELENIGSSLIGG